ncbi:TIP41-like protein [Picochlorum sp. SENEW3]|nr:TIP41-like protein [Picochlorum sp. SENEW3]
MEYPKQTIVDVPELKRCEGSVHFEEPSSSAATTAVHIRDWSIRLTHGSRIASQEERERLEEEMYSSQEQGEGDQGPTIRNLPEQVYSENVLVLEHRPSGNTIRFSAADALQQWICDGNEPIQLNISEKWQQERKKDAAEATRVVYDWTYTTSYVGSCEGWDVPRETQEQMDKALLMDRRAPILVFDSFPLYVSELDDMGVSEASVKIRVMPECWFVLLRFFLRIDGQLVRIRDARYFCNFGHGETVLREVRWQEATSGVGYCNADEAAQMLQALAPSGVQHYAMEKLFVG